MTLRQQAMVSDSNMMLFMSCDAMSCPFHHVQRSEIQRAESREQRADNSIVYRAHEHGHRVIATEHKLMEHGAWSTEHRELRRAHRDQSTAEQRAELQSREIRDQRAESRDQESRSREQRAPYRYHLL
jgi:hypothetical protein